jgi:hypothetical protein
MHDLDDQIRHNVDRALATRENLSAVNSNDSANATARVAQLLAWV